MTSGESLGAAGGKRPRTVYCGTPYIRPMSSSGRRLVDMMMMTMMSHSLAVTRRGYNCLLPMLAVLWGEEDDNCILICRSNTNRATIRIACKYNALQNTDLCPSTYGVGVEPRATVIPLANTASRL
ncbi:jg26148 [Pararge aegeria aegeria]|uniref:Jg26148 protein n=1 Tax=Pararge aegeria aegeria TaxID=348720 RepID=A0A8S4S1C6_9NEOP|nr:jg26148 [Pararge aegeria aegeria]